MPYRMLEYMVMLMKHYKGKSIKQKVLYIGQQKICMQNKLKLYDLKYSFEIVDVRELNCEELLNSDTIYDVIAAVLCKSGGKLHTN